MKFINTELPDVIIIEPNVFGDDRGYFFESYRKKEFAKAGITDEFVQDNHSRSKKGVIRGLHYQIKHPQGKIVRVISGEVFDVAVEIRKSSPHFGKWVGVTLSAENKKMMWIPEGFAHGFQVISDDAEFLYKVTDYWSPECERSIRWDDPDIAIDWPIKEVTKISEKDKHAVLLKDAEIYMG